MFRPKYLLYLGLLALVVLGPFIFKNEYQREIMVLIVIFAIAAVSLDLIMGHMGQFSFGHAAFFGMGAYASAKFSLSLGQSAWLGFIIAPIAAGIVGFFLGYVSLRRTRGVELAIITFGFGAIMFVISQRWSSFTGGMTGLHNVPPPSFFPWELRSEIAYYYFALPILAAVLYSVYRFSDSRLGRAVRSVRENEELAMSVGVSPTRYYVTAFTLACALVGFAGALYGHHLRFVNPPLLDTPQTIILVMMVLIGGVGTLWGPVLGAVFYYSVGEALRAYLNPELRLLILGAILMFIVLFMPHGLYPTLTSLWQWVVVDRNWRRGLKRPGLTPTPAGAGSRGSADGDG